MIGHFFDIETLFKMEQKIWIIDKNKPTIPLLRLSKSDYNVIKNELYLNRDLKLRIGSKYYYFDEDGFSSIKLACKKFRTNINDIEFSFVEFENDEAMESLKYTIDLSVMKHLFMSDDVVYIFCSKMKSKFYDSLIEKLDKEMRLKGVKPRDFYYLIEDQTKVVEQDIVVYKKIKILLQHLVGYKTEGNSFIDEKITEFDNVYYYGNNRSESKSIGISDKVFKNILNNSKGYLKDIIIDIVKKSKKTLTSNYVSPNKVNRFESSSYDLEYNNRLKRFGDF